MDFSGWRGSSGVGSRADAKLGRLDGMWLSRRFAIPAWVLVLMTLLSSAAGYWLGNTVPNGPL